MHLFFQIMADKMTTTIFVNDSGLPRNNTTSHEHSACTLFYDNDEVMLSHIICLYGTAFFVIIGLTGNIMNILVFSRKDMRNVSSNIYLLLLALSDSIYLVSVFSSKILNTLYCLYYRDSAIDIYNRSNTMCRTVQFLMDLTSDYSTCLVLLFTLERFVAVFAPTQFKSLCTAQRAKIVCFVMFLITVGSIGPYHFMYMKVQVTKTGNMYCAIDSHYESVFSTTYVVEMIIYRVIPTVLTAGFNISIIYKVIKLKRKRQKWSNIQNKGKAQKRDDRSIQLTIMLIIVSSTYIILFLPVLTVFFITKLRREYEFIRLSIPVDPLFAFKNYAELLYVIGHSINVFLYTITGQVFREQLLQLLCSRRERTKTNGKFVELHQVNNTTTQQTAL